MRKEFMVIAAVMAVALLGYLSWESAREGPALQTSTHPVAAPQSTAAQSAPAAAPAQTTPAQTPAAPAK